MIGSNKAQLDVVTDGIVFRMEGIMLDPMENSLMYETLWRDVKNRNTTLENTTHNLPVL